MNETDELRKIIVERDQSIFELEDKVKFLEEQLRFSHVSEKSADVNVQRLMTALQTTESQLESLRVLLMETLTENNSLKLDVANKLWKSTAQVVVHAYRTVLLEAFAESTAFCSSLMDFYRRTSVRTTLNRVMMVAAPSQSDFSARHWQEFEESIRSGREEAKDLRIDRDRHARLLADLIIKRDTCTTCRGASLSVVVRRTGGCSTSTQTQENSSGGTTAFTGKFTVATTTTSLAPKTVDPLLDLRALYTDAIAVRQALLTEVATNNSTLMISPIVMMQQPQPFESTNTERMMRKQQNRIDQLRNDVLHLSVTQSISTPSRRFKI